MTRCIHCTRCIRFTTEVGGISELGATGRGEDMEITTYLEHAMTSELQGNVIDLCPVGALTGAAYRFRARPFDLVSTPSVCEHCAGGCAQRTDHRRGKVTRRLAGDDPQVNEEWNCDKGRWAFTYATQPDRLKHPLVRDEDSRALEAASWPEALQVAARPGRFDRPAQGDA